MWFSEFTAETVLPTVGLWRLSTVFRERQGGPGSVRFGYGLGVEGFERFRFSVLAVPLQKGFFLCFSTV